ncbi:MAG TPA: hypothetical protein VJH70_02925 [Candidatus Paceibacterota bacterium]
MIWIICSIFIAVILFTRCWVIVGGYEGLVVLNVITTKERGLGPGLHLMFPWENVVENSKTDLVTLSHHFMIVLETENGEPVTIDCDFTTIPSVEDLVQFRRFKKEERLKAITENLKSFLTSIQKEYGNRKTMMDKSIEITGRVKDFIEHALIAVEGKPFSWEDKAKDLKKRYVEIDPTREDGGMNMREYYGVQLPVFIIGDVELPKELYDATVKKETVNQENLARLSEMKNVVERAKSLVKASNGGTNMEDATKIVQIQDGKIKEDRKIFGLDKGSRDPIVNAIKEVLTHVFGKKQSDN